jgi:hypothetical protein
VTGLVRPRPSGAPGHQQRSVRVDRGLADVDGVVAGRGARVVGGAAGADREAAHWAKDDERRGFLHLESSPVAGLWPANAGLVQLHLLRCYSIKYTPTQDFVKYYCVDELKRRPNFWAPTGGPRGPPQHLLAFWRLSWLFLPSRYCGRFRRAAVRWAWYFSLPLMTLSGGLSSPALLILLLINLLSKS